jgi:hypothetical protein
MSHVGLAPTPEKIVSLRFEEIERVGWIED